MQMYDNEKLNILHFQHCLYDLGNGYFMVLEKRGFYSDLQNYLKRLFELGHKRIICNILARVGKCAVEHENHRLRLRALGLIIDFSNLLRTQRDQDLFRTVAIILAKWLSEEREFHPGYEKVFVQLRTIIIRMFSLQLWNQCIPLLAASRDIICGTVPADIHFKNRVNKLHKDVADQKTIDFLVQSFLPSHVSRQVETCDILKAFAPYSAEAMIHSLFKCNKKEKRLALLETIMQEPEGILPILVEKLKDKQPWYVVRNSMILLGGLKDADLYSFAHPFLCHPDSRVQCEVLNCTRALGGEYMSDRLMTAFSIINDDVKGHLIGLLGSLKDPKIATMFVSMLEQRMSFSAKLREQLVLAVCCSGQLHSSKRAVNVLKDIVNEGEQLSVDCEPTREVAGKLLKKFKNAE